MNILTHSDEFVGLKKNNRKNWWRCDKKNIRRQLISLFNIALFFKREIHLFKKYFLLKYVYLRIRNPDGLFFINVGLDILKDQKAIAKTSIL